MSSMKSVRFLARVLNVHQKDIRTVFPMLLLAFFSGLGISTAFTAINVSLIEHHGTYMLPIILMLSGVVLLGAGYIYSLLEHRFGPARLYTIIIWISVLWAALSYFLLSHDDIAYRHIISYVSYYVIYLLYNLQFWAVAALLFSARQSKTVFGLLTSGESLAKILGYSLTPVIIIQFNLYGLLMVSAVCFLLSWPIWLFTSRKVKFSSIEHELHEHAVQHQPAEQLLNALKNVSFFRVVSIFALLSVLIYHIINYAFLTQVEAQFSELSKLAIFFGAIYGFGKFLNFTIKGLLTSRLLKSLGIYRVLLILPVLLLLVHFVGFLGSFDGAENSSVLLWVFSISMLLDEIIRSSIVKPSFLILFQPLAKNMRLLGHTIAKGIMEPLGVLLAGVLTYILINTFHVSLAWLNLLLIGLLVLWIYYIAKTRNSHLAMIINAVKKRILPSDHKENELDHLVKLQLNKHLKNTDQLLEIVYLLKLLKKIPNEDISNKIAEIVQEKPMQIDEQLQFFDYINHYPDSHFFDIVAQWHNSDHPMVREKAIDTLFSLNLEKAESLMPLHKDNRKYDPIMLGSVLKHGGIYAAINYGQHLMKLLNSEQPKERLIGLDTLSITRNQDFYQPLIKLIEDTDQQVRDRAIELSGHIQSSKLLPKLFKQLAGESSAVAKIAIIRYGEKAVHYIMNHADRMDHKLILYKILEDIKAETPVPWLLNQLTKADFLQERAIAQALSSSIAHPLKLSDQNALIEIIARSIEIVNKLGYPQEAPSLWKQSIITERNSRLDTIVQFLKCIHLDHSCSDALDQLRWGNTDKKSAALEHLELVLDKKINTALITLLERHYIYEDTPKGSKYIRLNKVILNSLDEDTYSPWLIAITLRIYGEKSQIQASDRSHSSIITQELNRISNG